MENKWNWEMVVDMTLEEMRESKREKGYSNEELAELSGVPLGTVQKIMSGITRNPRRKTRAALEMVLCDRYNLAADRSAEDKENRERPVPMELLWAGYDRSCMREAGVAYQPHQRPCTIEDIYALPPGLRAELIDGRLYYMATPTRTHQKIAGGMYLTVANYINAHNGKCEVYIPPFGVYLFADTVYLEPDLCVICDLDKLNERGCNGAPDWVVEVVSPSSKTLDYNTKMLKYRAAGVREYWVINPDKRNVLIYLFGEEQEEVEMYSFEDEIPCFLYPDLTVRIDSLL